MKISDNLLEKRFHNREYDIKSRNIYIFISVKSRNKYSYMSVISRNISSDQKTPLPEAARFMDTRDKPDSVEEIYVSIPP